MHIGWAMVFDPLPRGGTPPVQEIRELLDRRSMPCRAFASGSPTSAPVACGGRTGSTTPTEVSSHVRHATLPAPGGEAELLDWMADFYSHRLDRSRPLWEITLLDGLAGGRWALVTKVHHCLVDGVSGVSVTNLILDDSPEPSPAGDTARSAPDPRDERPPARPPLCTGAPVPASTWRCIRTAYVKPWSKRSASRSSSRATS